MSALEGPGPFTVFAPINQAFEALGRNILDFVLNPHNIKTLDGVLTYHVHSGEVKSTQITNGEVISTLDGQQTLTATVGNGAVKINQATVIKADNLATNGVVHIVDAVLVPSDFALPPNDIVKTAQSVSTLSTLVQAVIAGNLTGALSMPNGPYTVFAPNNAAFAKIPSNVLNYLLSHPKELDNVLLYHVLDHRVYAEQIRNYGVEHTLQGEDIVFLVNSTGVYINGESLVIATNVDCTNGVVHVIDTVILPKQAQAELYAKAAAWASKKLGAKQVNPKNLPNIIQIAAADPNLSTLVTAVKAAGLVNTLSGAGPFTVFAPTNDAFNYLPNGVLNFLLNPANIKQLQQVITYHALGEAVFSKDLKDGEIVPTLEGDNLVVHIDERKRVFINYAVVLKADIAASNGVVHVIDAVLLPFNATQVKKSLRA